MMRSLILCCTSIIAIGCSHVDGDGASGPTSATDGKADGLFGVDAVDFWCQTSGWVRYEDSEFNESYDRAFLMTVGCETAEAWTRNGALKAARTACANWADSAGIDAELVEAVTYQGRQREQCHGDWLEFERENFIEPRHNRLHRASDDFSHLGFTSAFVDNRGAEQPIARADGSEQPQWVTVGSNDYCGFPGADIAFFENRAQNMVVRQLSTGRQAVYAPVDVDEFEFRTDAFQLLESPNGTDEFAELTSVDFLTRSADMGGNTIELRPTMSGPAVGFYDLSYFRLAGETLCQP